MRSAEEFSVLVRVSVDCVIEKVAANAAVIEERIPLARSTITSDRFPFPLHPNQKVQNLALGFLYLFCKGEVCFQTGKAGFLFSFRQFPGTQRHWTRMILVMP